MHVFTSILNFKFSMPTTCTQQLTVLTPHSYHTPHSLLCQATCTPHVHTTQLIVLTPHEHYMHHIRSLSCSHLTHTTCMYTQHSLLANCAYTTRTPQPTILFA